MAACKASLFRSALVAMLVHSVRGNEFRAAANTDVHLGEVAAASSSNARSRDFEEVSSRVAVPDASRFEARAELEAGPDPFFADLEVDVLQQGESESHEASSKRRTFSVHTVEVYEVQSGGLARRWREWRTGWTYKDGSAALPPKQILCPDEWTWTSEWKIDGSGGRDIGGWEYSKDLHKFNSSRVPRGKKLADRFRRRRWVRAMQCTRPQREQQQEDLNEVGLQLEGLSDNTGMMAPAGMYEFGAEDFRFDVERDDVDLFPAPDIQERPAGMARKPLKLPEFGNALTACKGWWTEEFTFRGFGIGFVKPVFRGLLLRPDFGLGVRLPVTLHFRSWESREALPAVALSFFVLWPPAVQVSQAMSYPAELLQEWATTAARKIAVPSKEAIQVRRRKEAVQRLGVSIGVRYSAPYGFQWWLAPYFFLLPGVRVIWTLYQSMMTMLLSSLALMQRSDASGVNTKSRKEDNQEALWIVALRSWAAAKTSGLGYSLYYSGNRLGGAAYVNFMPFFLPTFGAKRLTSAEVDGVENPGIEHQPAALRISDEATAPEVAVESVLVDMDHGEHSVELGESHVPLREGAVLESRSA